MDPVNDTAAAHRSRLSLVERVILPATLASASITAVSKFVLHAPAPLIFLLSSIALALLAWVLGRATEQLGAHIGGRLAGLLNATLGNLPELVIVLLLLYEAKKHPALVEVAKASILGSVLGNMLFVLGAAALLGGIKNGTQRFGRTFASLNSTMVVLAVAAISVPTLIKFTPGSAGLTHVNELSIGTSVVLLITYMAALRFFATDTEHAAQEDEAAHWSKALSIGVLVVAALGVGLTSEILVNVIEPTVTEVGISEAFVGFILVPIVGNIAEHLVAVQLAWRNDMDFSIAIALGSSVQVALALAPIAVLASFYIGQPMNLVFQPIQLMSILLASLIVPQVVNDGELTWIEGMQLLALYAIIAIAFWY